jgi:hypothetical protein
MRTTSISSIGYAPGEPPRDPEQLQRYLREEFTKISVAVQQLAAGHLDVQTVALAKPRDGDLRYADGTNWAPITGAGRSLFAYIQTAWQRLLTSAGLYVKEGSNALMGTATLVAGTVTVSNTSVAANSRIFLCSNADGGTPGFLRVSARVAGTSFTITSSSATDTSTVAYIIAQPL